MSTVMGPDGRVRSPFLEATRRLEVDERLDAVAAVLARPGRAVSRGAVRSVLGGRWLGHALHPLLTDFPLGCWIGAGLLDVLSGRSSRAAARRLVGLGVLFAIPTAAAGLSDWSAVDDPQTRRVGAAHALLNSAVGGCYLLSWSLRRRGRHRTGIAAALLGGGTAWVSGYLGGHMSLRQYVGTGEPVPAPDRDAEATA